MICPGSKLWRLDCTPRKEGREEVEQLIVFSPTAVAELLYVRC